MSRIFVRVLLTLAVIAAIATTVITVMKKMPTKQRYPIALSSQTLEDAVTVTERDIPEGVTRNVILILGDGMGTAYIEAARLTSVGPAGQLEMQKLPSRGMVTTRSANNLVTDSGAAATAIATGVKTNNRMISVDPEGNVLRTIVEAARLAGFVTGIVTTTSAADATPAAFAAHQASRDDRESIASQLVAANLDLLIGSNVKYFVPSSQPGGRRTDGVDLLANAAAAGTEVARDLGGLRAAATLPLIAIFDERQRPPLPDVTLESLRLIEARGERFFLMIESEAIDSATHDNDLGRTLSAVRELDQAVKAAVEWARRDGSTLVVVTADHDTAGMQIIPSKSPKLLQVVWPTTAHTAQDVALYAFGPGAESFEGHLDNTDIAPTLARLLGIEDAFRAPEAAGPTPVPE